MFTGPKNTERSGSPCGLLRRLAIMFYDGIIVISLLMLATLLAMPAGLGGRTAMKDPVYTGVPVCGLVSVSLLVLAQGWNDRRHAGMARKNRGQRGA